MDFRDIFTNDILRDPELLRVLVYSLRDVQEAALPVMLDGEIIVLQPYEVLIEYEQMARELGVEKESFLPKLELLEKLRRVRLTLGDRCVRVQFTTLRLPIGGVKDVPKPGAEIIEISLSRWREIDVEYIRCRDSKKYCDMVRQTLKRFERFVGSRALHEISLSDFNGFVAEIRRGGAGNRSINIARRVLIASLERARAGGYLKVNPLEKSKALPTSRPKVRIVEKEELDILFRIIGNGWLRDVIEFVLLSAKRHGEVLNLRWGDIDRALHTIAIHSTPEYRVKFGKEQILHLSSSLNNLLDRVEKAQRMAGIEPDHIFVDEAGKPLTQRKVRERLNAAKEAAGLGDHITMHAFRKTAATRLREKGNSMQVISRVLNHSEENVTQRYVGVPKETEVAALEMLCCSDFLPIPLSV